MRAPQKQKAVGLKIETSATNPQPIDSLWVMRNWLCLAIFCSSSVRPGSSVSPPFRIASVSSVFAGRREKAAGLGQTVAQPCPTRVAGRIAGRYSKRGPPRVAGATVVVEAPQASRRVSTRQAESLRHDGTIVICRCTFFAASTCCVPGSGCRIKTRRRAASRSWSGSWRRSGKPGRR